jgi:hypothetical protein
MRDRFRRDPFPSEHPGNLVNPILAAHRFHADAGSPIVPEELPDHRLMVGPGSDLGEMSDA